MKFTEQTVKRREYSGIELGSMRYVLIDFVDESGNIIDTILRDHRGCDIDDAIIFEHVEALVDNFNH